MKKIYLNEQGEQIVGVSRDGEGLTQEQMDCLEARADLAAHGD